MFSDVWLDYAKICEVTLNSVTVLDPGDKNTNSLCLPPYSYVFRMSFFIGVLVVFVAGTLNNIFTGFWRKNVTSSLEFG